MTGRKTKMETTASVWNLREKDKVFFIFFELQVYIFYFIIPSVETANRQLKQQALCVTEMITKHFLHHIVIIYQCFYLESNSVHLLE